MRDRSSEPVAHEIEAALRCLDTGWNEARARAAMAAVQRRLRRVSSARSVAKVGVLVLVGALLGSLLAWWAS